MKATTNELLEFFKGIYQDDKEADEIKAGIRDDLKSYAEEIETDAKSLRSAYSLFKKYADGHLSSEKSNDYSELTNIVINYFEE